MRVWLLFLLLASATTNVYSQYYEQAPVFPGGINGLNRYVATNTKYPAKARIKGIEGTVVVQFTIKENGKVSDIKILRPLGEGCSNSVIKMVKKMPRWAPGKRNGVAVKMNYQLPVNFVLPKEPIKKKNYKTTEI